MNIIGYAETTNTQIYGIGRYGRLLLCLFFLLSSSSCVSSPC